MDQENKGITGMIKEYRVIGPPGTGKTTWMARQVKAAVEKHGADKVLVTSFTRAAAKEIAGRDLGINSESSRMVGTLHSLCFHALGKPTIAESKLEEWNTKMIHVSSWICLPQGVDLDDLGAIGEAASDGDKLKMKASRWRSLMIPHSRWINTPEGLWFEAWKQWCQQEGYTDFTGLIERALEEVEYAPGYPKVAFIDEVQDMSPLELALVRSWGSKMEGILLAGDPDQSIYGFKGASPRAFYHPEIDEKDYRILGQGYRVPQSVHAWSTDWIKKASDHRPVEYMPRHGDQGEVVKINDPAVNYRTASADCDWFTDLVDKNSSGTMMILASCAYMLTPSIKALKDLGVPFHNPYRSHRGDWNPMRGGVDRVLRFLAPAMSGRVQWTWSELHQWSSIVKAKGAMKHGAKSLIESNSKGMLSKIFVKHEELEAMFEKDFYDEALGHAHDLTSRPWKWLMDQAADSGKLLYACNVADRCGWRGLVDQPKVIVGTIHSVKGGQADTVLMFPDMSPAAWKEYEADDDGRNGAVRLFYVGATRAASKLILAQRGTQFSVW